jgi:hypothetical protein
MPTYSSAPTTYQVWFASPETGWFWFYDQRFHDPENGTTARRSAYQYAKRIRLQQTDRIVAVSPLGRIPKDINRPTINRRRIPSHV